MSSRSLLLGAALGLAISTAACSSLTRPDEIQIAPEPRPAPAAAHPAGAAARPAPAGAAAPNAGGCGP